MKPQLNKQNYEERHVEIVEMKTQKKLILVEWIKWKTDKRKDR